jgi:polyvinyl alcohol dehydrogenase (cytochrome)
MLDRIGRPGTLLRAASVAAVAVLVMAGPAAAQARSAATAPGWPQLQGSAAHTGYEAAETSVTPKNVSQLSLDWTTTLAGPSTSSEPVVAGGTVYVNAGNTVTAYNTGTGTEMWQATVPHDDLTLGTPSVQNGLVVFSYAYIGTRMTREYVSAVNSSTGAPVWTTQIFNRSDTGLGFSGTVATTSSRAYVAMPNGQVEALGLARGNMVWRSPAVSGCDISAPSVSGDLAVVDGGAYVTAIDTKNGQVAWTADPGGSDCTGGDGELWLPVISDGTVYAGTGDGVTALSLSSGSQLWQNTSTPSALGPFSLTKNALLVSWGSGKNFSLDALSPATGSALWQVAEQAGPLATFGGLTWSIEVTYPEGDAQAVAFSASNGKLLYTSAQFPLGVNILSPVVSAGHVYVNMGNELECLALPS